MYELIINNKTYYVLDGYLYTIDTLPIECIFDNI